MNDISEHFLEPAEGANALRVVPGYETPISANPTTQLLLDGGSKNIMVTWAGLEAITVYMTNYWTSAANRRFIAAEIPEAPEGTQRMVMISASSSERQYFLANITGGGSPSASTIQKQFQLGLTIFPLLVD